MATLTSPVDRSVLECAFRDVVGVMQDAGVPFALTGSFGAWALGGPPPPLVEDVDVAVRAADVVTAASAFRERGYRIEACAEGWLAKAFHPSTNARGEHLFVDIIHGLVGLPITDEVLDRAVTTYVCAMAVRVLAPIDMMSTRLGVISPSNLDYTGVLMHARALREQFDWDELEQRAAGNAAALGFFDVARRLGVDPRHPIAQPQPPRHPAAERVVRLEESERRRLEQLTGGDPGGSAGPASARSHAAPSR